MNRQYHCGYDKESVCIPATYGCLDDPPCKECYVKRKDEAKKRLEKQKTAMEVDNMHTAINKHTPKPREHIINEDGMARTKKMS